MDHNPLPRAGFWQAQASGYRVFIPTSLPSSLVWSDTLYNQLALANLALGRL